MHRSWLAVIPVFLILTGCGGDTGNPPAQVAELTQEQIDAAEQHEKQVSSIERQHETATATAVYMTLEEHRVNVTEREHEAAMERERNQKK